MPAVEAVTFDFWNTLCRETVRLRDHRLDAWLGLLEDAGFAVERAALDQAFAASWERFQEHWAANRQYTAVEAAVDVVEQLGYDLPPGVHDELVATYHRTDGPFPEVVEGAGDCLRTLKSAGVRLGIICDVGLAPSTFLRSVLDKEGLLDLFDHWSFSDEVGHYKPSRAIFEHALAGLGGVVPERAAHIGDLRRTDIAGAQAMGITSIRFTGVFDDPEVEGIPEADHVVGDLRELPGVLGIS